MITKSKSPKHYDMYENLNFSKLVYVGKGNYNSTTTAINITTTSQQQQLQQQQKHYQKH